jgi:hypothetical protein
LSRQLDTSLMDDCGPANNINLFIIYCSNVVSY